MTGRRLTTPVVPTSTRSTVAAGGDLLQSLVALDQPRPVRELQPGRCSCVGQRDKRGAMVLDLCS